MGIDNLKVMSAEGMMTQGASFPGSCGKYTCNYIPDVEYANIGGRSLKLQIIKPERDDIKFPLIVYVKGSSWLKQKVYKNIPKLCALAEYGFVIAQVEYRESPQGSHADKIEDTKAAIRFMRSHSEEYCVDCERVALFGDSSGGHVALMAAMDNTENVRCVADFYGVTDIVSLMQDFYHSSGKEMEDYLNNTFFAGKCNGDVVEECNKISPIYNVNKNIKLPPVLIVHGDADKVVGFDQSARFAKVLQENNQTVYLYKIMGADHDIGVWGDERTKLLVDFFNSYMK